MTTTAEKELVIKKGAAGAAKPNRYGLTIASAADLGMKVEGSVADAPSDIQDAIQSWQSGYMANALSNTEKYLQRLEAAQMGKAWSNGAGLGEVTTTSGAFPYVSFDIVAAAPVQFIPVNGPPYAPNRIAAAGELMLLQALLFINPVPCTSCGFAVQPTVILGGNSIAVRFEQLNITAGTALPPITLSGVLPAVAPALISVAALIVAPPVLRPNLFELNVTADITTPAKPFAAFATWHQDTDAEFPWFQGGTFPPALAPQFEHDIPVRYLVYPK